MTKMSAIFLILVVVSVFDLTTSTNTCTWGFYKCGSATQCIASRNRCDGTTQCLNGQDERNCPSRCTGSFNGNFRCRNTATCISRSYLCNGVSNCNDGSDEDTSLCGGAAFPVRLVGGGSSNQGRVEVYYQYRWGTVCDDDWGINDAIVVCRQLGLPRATRAVSGAGYGRGTGHIYLDDVHCTGQELSLSKCSSGGWNNHNCGHNEDAGVVCGSGVVRPNSCTWGRFRCSRSSSSRCIASRYRCDGTSQCTQGEDEASCPTRCSTSSQFRCNNYKCISRNFLCDNDNDCGDLSDESTALCGTPSSGSSRLRCYVCHSPTSCKNPTTYQCASGVSHCIKTKAISTTGGQETEMEAALCDVSFCSLSFYAYCGNRTNCKRHCCTSSNCNDPRTGYGDNAGPKVTKCYTCTSTKSYNDCKLSAVLRTCNSDESTCYKADYGIESPTTGPYGQSSTNTRRYGKGCVASSQCSQNRLLFCRRYGLTNSDCNVHCCTGDGCNAGSVFRVSRIMLLVCAVVCVLLFR